MRPAWASKGTGSFGTPKAVDAGPEVQEHIQAKIDAGNGDGNQGSLRGVWSGGTGVAGATFRAVTLSAFQQSTGRKSIVRLAPDQLLAIRRTTKVNHTIIDKLPKEIVSENSDAAGKSTDDRSAHRMWHDVASGGSRGAGRRTVTGKGESSPGFGPQGSGPSDGLGRWGGTNTQPSGFGNGGWRRGQAAAAGAFGSGSGVGGGSGISGSAPTSALSTSGLGSKRSPVQRGLGEPPEEGLGGLGAFSLGAPAGIQGSGPDGGGSWRRGLKVGDVAPSQQSMSGRTMESALASDSNEYDDFDGTMDLSGLSMAALEFELEKRKMHDLFAGGEGDGLRDGGLGSGLDSVAETSGSGLGGGLEDFPKREAVRPPRQQQPQAQQPQMQRLQQHSLHVTDPQVMHGQLDASIPRFFGGILTGGDGPTSFAAPAPPSDDWFYKDPSGNVQGPFSGDLMRQWYSQGCFDSVPNLPLRNGTTGTFEPLSGMFQSGQMFRPAMSSHSPILHHHQQRMQLQQHHLQQQQLQQEVAKATQAAEEAQRELALRQAQEEAERARAEKELEEQKAELERQERERVAAAAERAEAKREEEKATPPASGKDAGALASESRASAWGKASNGHGDGSAAGSILDIQAQESKQASQLKAMLGMERVGSDLSSSGSSGSGASVWGVAAYGPERARSLVSGTVPAGALSMKTSLADIQAEEAQAAAARAVAQPKVSGGHWAAMAAGQGGASQGAWSGESSATRVAFAGSQQQSNKPLPVRILSAPLRGIMQQPSSERPLQIAPVSRAPQQSFSTMDGSVYAPQGSKRGAVSVVATAGRSAQANKVRFSLFLSSDISVGFTLLNFFNRRHNCPLIG